MHREQSKEIKGETRKRGLSTVWIPAGFPIHSLLLPKVLLPPGAEPCQRLLFVSQESPAKPHGFAEVIFLFCGTTEA